MGTKDARAAHGALGKTDVLQFDPDHIVLVEEENHALYDDRVHEQPTEAFIEDLMARGVLVPCLGRKDTESGKSIIEDGRKRTLGLREANKRLRAKGVAKADLWRLPVIIKRGTEGDAILRMLATNEHRFADTPLNKARKAARAIDRGKTEAEVATALGVTMSTLKNLLALIDAPAAVRNAADAGKITASDAYKLAKLPAEEAREKVQQLIEQAPRTPGRKRSPNAKKARAIMGGGKKRKATSEPTATTSAAKTEDGVRGANQMENVQRDLEEEHKKVNGEAGSRIDGALAILRWYFGDNAALKELGL